MHDTLIDMPTGEQIVVEPQVDYLQEYYDQIPVVSG